MKHIIVGCHFIRQKIETGASQYFCLLDDQLADIIRKSLWQQLLIP